MNKTFFTEHIAQFREYQFSWYETVCETKNQRNQPALFMVHGIGASAKYWFPVAKRIASQYRIILIDRIGYGKSKGPLNASLEETAFILNEFLETMKIETDVIYVGHSYGGLIGLQLALQGSNIDSFVLVSSFDKFFVDEDWIKHAARSQDLMNNICNGFMPDCNIDVIEKFKREAFAMPVEVIRNDFQICMESDLRGKIQNIRKKIYFISGKDDKVISIRKSHKMHKQIKNSELVELNNAGHNLIIENPDVVAEILNTCIRKSNEEVDKDEQVYKTSK